MSLAAAISDHARTIIRDRLGYVGRFDRLTIAAVDATNRVATCAAPSGATVYATYTSIPPAIGQEWIAYRTPDGNYVLITIARGA